MSWADVLRLGVYMVVPIVGLFIQWGRFQERLNGHEALDNERFRNVEKLLREVRDDVKTLVRDRVE